MSTATTDCTQILHIPFHANIPIPQGGAVEKLLNRVFDIPKKSRGFKRLYWGRRHEDQMLQIHIVRDTLFNNKEWLASPSYQDFLTILKPLVMGGIVIRHAYLAEYNTGCQALGKGSPFTGTAYYLSPRPSSTIPPYTPSSPPSPDSWDYAWARWATIISRVPGFMGISGGPVVEDVNGHATSFLVFVGWESTEKHNAYHHTEEFRRLRHVLNEPVKGYAYYGHVCFRNEETGDLKSEVVEGEGPLTKGAKL